MDHGHRKQIEKSKALPGFYNKLGDHSLNYGLSTDTILDPCQYFFGLYL
jgi:hypothetical protein